MKVNSGREAIRHLIPSSQRPVSRTARLRSQRGQIGHKNVEVKELKEVKKPASSGSCGSKCRRAGVFGDEDSCVAQVPATSSSRPISVGAGGHDRFPNSTRGVRLVQSGTSQACQATLRFPGRAYSASLHNQPTNSLNSTSLFIACQRTIA